MCPCLSTRRLIINFVYKLSIYCIYNDNILYRFNQGNWGEYLINIAAVPACAKRVWGFSPRFGGRLGNKFCVHPDQTNLKFKSPALYKLGGYCPALILTLPIHPKSALPPGGLRPWRSGCLCLGGCWLPQSTNCGSVGVGWQGGNMPAASGCATNHVWSPSPG